MPRRGCIAVGAVTAAIAWWYNLSHTRRALAYWGPAAVALIRDAPQVTAYAIAFEGTAAATAGDQRPLLHPTTRTRARLLESHDISRAKGLVHLRHALLDDLSFAWEARPGDAGDLSYALSFEDDASRLVVYFSSDFARMTVSRSDIAARPEGASPTTLSTGPIAGGLRTYFSEVFP